MKYYLSIFTLLFLISCSQAQKDPVFTTGAGAIKGYDPVSYFTEGKPVRGDKKITYTWNEADWHFSSMENLNLFKADPDKYAPQYGGYCAYAVSQGYTAKIDPDAWKIVDGKLYLNYDLQVQKQWEEQQAQFIQDANKNWPKVLE